MKVPFDTDGAETIGYCSVMGMEGEHMAIAVYLGSEEIGIAFYGKPEVKANSLQLQL